MYAGAHIRAHARVRSQGQGTLCTCWRGASDTIRCGEHKDADRRRIGSLGGIIPCKAPGPHPRMPSVPPAVGYGPHCRIIGAHSDR